DFFTAHTTDLFELILFIGVRRGTHVGLDSIRGGRGGRMIRTYVTPGPETLRLIEQLRTTRTLGGVAFQLGISQNTLLRAEKGRPMTRSSVFLLESKVRELAAAEVAK